MAVFFKASLAWFRRWLSWSNSRQSWIERLTFALLLAVAGFLFWSGSGLALSRQVFLWMLWLLAVIALLRRGWLKLFGPVLFYDLIRSSRRGRYFLLRIAYVTLILLLLLYVYTVSAPHGAALDRSELAEFASWFFFTFLSVQFFTSALLTPAFTAGAIAEEKERKTLEFLLATDLRNREIVLSKLASRLANVAFLLLAGLPILSLLQLLGGIDPELVLAGFGFTGLTVVNLAALSILNSVLLKKARDAIALTYGAGVAYLALSGASLLLLDPSFGVADFPSTATWTSRITVSDLVHGFNAGNIFYAWASLIDDSINGRPFANVVVVLRNYALFHALVALGCATWAVLRLRAIALKETSVPRQRRRRPSQWGRPRLGSRPMVWKEVHIEGGIRLGWLGRFVMLLLLLVSFVPLWFIFQEYLVTATSPWGHPNNDWQRVGEEVNLWVRTVGTIMGFLMLLSVAVRATGSISGERDRQTLDSLLTTPLDTDDILFGKWVGSVLSPRWAWVYLALIWFVSILAGGLHPLAVPLLITAWLVYAAFFAMLGLWFSTVSRTTQRATIYTILASFAAGGGHLLLWPCCCLPLMMNSRGPEPAELFKWIFGFHVFGLTPPASLAFLAFRGQEFEPSRRGFFSTADDSLGFLMCSMLGLAVWTMATFLLWEKTRGVFGEVAGRVPLRPRSRPNEPDQQRLVSAPERPRGTEESLPTNPNS